MTALNIAVFATLALAGQALAATPAPVRATLAAPVAHDGEVTAQATRWTCVGTACTGPEINLRFGDARACREIVKAAGAVTTFTGSHGDLSADDLARCNKSARKS